MPCSDFPGSEQLSALPFWSGRRMLKAVGPSGGCPVPSGPGGYGSRHPGIFDSAPDWRAATALGLICRIDRRRGTMPLKNRCLCASEHIILAGTSDQTQDIALFFAWWQRLGLIFSVCNGITILQQFTAISAGRIIPPALSFCAISERLSIFSFITFTILGYTH
jgi:hypothetical protein